MRYSSIIKLLSLNTGSTIKYWLTSSGLTKNKTYSYIIRMLSEIFLGIFTCVFTYWILLLVTGKPKGFPPGVL